MWILYWVGVIACAGLRVLDYLGNITLTNTETRVIDVTNLFQGVWVEYSLQHNDFPSRVSLDSENSVSQIAAIPLQTKLRKKGPAFTLGKNWYFVLYSVDTLELWRGERYPAKMWELHSIHAIAGVDYLQAEGLLYWTEDFLFFFVNLAEGNLTTHQISNITVPANAKVAVCSLTNVIVVAELGGTLDHCSHSLLDTEGMSVQSQQVTFLNSNATVIDVICTDTLYVLTSIGVVTYLEILVDSDTPVTAISKESEKLAVVYMEKAMLAIKASGSMLYLPIVEGVTLHCWMKGDAALSVAYANNSYWVISNTWQQSLIPTSPGKKYFFILSDGSTFIGISESEMSVYSHQDHGALLMLTGAIHPYSFSLCAFEWYADQSICLSIQVRTIQCDENAVLISNQLELSEDSSQILRTVPVYNSLSQMIMLSIPYYFSGPNLNYSIGFFDIPPYVSIVSLLDSIPFKIETVRTSFRPQKLNSQKCASKSDDLLFALLSGNHIEIHLIIMRTFYLSVEKIQVDFNVSLCAFRWSQLYYYGVDDAGRGYFATGRVTRSQPISREVHFIGMLSSSDTIVAYTQFEVYEVDPLNLDVQMKLRSECAITGVAVDEDCIWVLCKGQIQRWSRYGLPINSFPIPVVSEVLINHNALVLRQAGDLSMYRVVAEKLVMIKTVSLSLDCAGMLIDSGIVSITCSRGIQIISISNAAHNSKMFLIPSNSESHQLLVMSKYGTTQIKLFALGCDMNNCQVDCVVFPIEANNMANINIKIANSSLFAASKQTLVVSEIRARNEYQSSTRKLVLDIQNVGYFIQLNMTWEQFTFSVPWTDTLSIDLSHLFIGHNITLTTNTSECQLQPKSEVKNRVRVRDIGVMDLSEDLNVFFRWKGDTIEMYQYSCVNFWCRSQPVYEMSQLNFTAISSVKVLCSQGYYVLLQLKGVLLSRRSMELVLSVDVSSYTYSVVYLELLIKSNVAILRESSEVTHIFRYGSIFTHYVLKWYFGFAVVSKTTRFLPVTSVGAVYLESEWRLYLHDSYSGVLEFALRNSSMVFLRSVALDPRFTYFSMLIWRRLALLSRGSHYDVYSIPDFSFIDILTCFGQNGCFSYHDIQLNTSLISVSLMHMRLGLADQTSIFQILPCTSFVFSSVSDGSCFNPEDNTFDFYHFGIPVLTCLSNFTRADSTTFRFVIQAENGVSGLSSPIFTIHRYVAKDSKLAWIAVGCLCIAICTLIWWKCQKKKVRIIAEIELANAVEKQEEYSSDSQRD